MQTNFLISSDYRICITNIIFFAFIVILSSQRVVWLIGWLVGVNLINFDQFWFSCIVLFLLMPQFKIFYLLVLITWSTNSVNSIVLVDWKDESHHVCVYALACESVRFSSNANYAKIIFVYMQIKKSWYPSLLGAGMSSATPAMQSTTMGTRHVSATPTGLTCDTTCRFCIQTHLIKWRCGHGTRLIAYQQTLWRVTRSRRGLSCSWYSGSCLVVSAWATTRARTQRRHAALSRT